MNKLSAAIFDLDGTLYVTDEIDDQNAYAAASAIAEHKGIPIVDAQFLLQESRRNPTNNEAYSISQTLSNMGIPQYIIASKQLKLIRPEGLIATDRELVELLHSLRASIKIAVFTNTHKEIAIRILHCLGLAIADFDLIYAGTDLANPKPDSVELNKCLYKLKALPESSIMIGDRWDVDIQPAIDIGMQYLLVQNVNELKSWIRSYLYNCE